jgi:hypothetical protein
MKNTALVLLFIFITSTLPAQVNNTWYSFWNKDTTLIGFKDKNGIVKIEPKFTGLTTPGGLTILLRLLKKRMETGIIIISLNQGRSSAGTVFSFLTIQQIVNMKVLVCSLVRPNCNNELTRHSNCNNKH